MTIWHNLAGVVIGLVVVALGRLVIVKARGLADLTIDLESSWPGACAEWGNDRSRRAEATWTRVFGGLAVGLGTIFSLISAAQFLYRLFN